MSRPSSRGWFNLRREPLVWFVVLGAVLGAGWIWLAPVDTETTLLSSRRQARAGPPGSVFPEGVDRVGPRRP